VRSTKTSRDLLNEVRSAAAGINPALAILNFKSADEYLADLLGVPLQITMMMGVCGAVALILSALGLYGMMAQSVAERTREIGIRLALGGNSLHIIALVFREAAVRLAWGMLLGLAGCFVLSQILGSVLPNVQVRDPLTYVPAVIVFCVVSVLACYLPVRKALVVDPVSVLKSDC